MFLLKFIYRKADKMAVKISGILIAVSFVFALMSGNMQALSAAAVAGCSKGGYPYAIASWNDVFMERDYACCRGSWCFTKAL